jgi:tryptophanyl-tRNA synthetase
VGDILHVQLEQYGGSVPTLVPVGVDQDPHIRLTREVAFAHRLFNTTLTKDDKFGVFVKVDKDVKKLLDAAEQTLRDLGFREFNKIARYKALYVRDASAKDIPLVDEALLQVETQFGGYGFYQPAATYHRLMTGLTGGKMSSSVPESSIFLTDEPEIGAKKINLCKTGGGVSLEEQRKYGGKPEECVVYELFLYHLLEDDSELNEIYEACRGGKQLCGKCKKYASELTSKFLADLREKRALAHEEINEYIRED